MSDESILNTSLREFRVREKRSPSLEELQGETEFESRRFHRALDSAEKGNFVAVENGIVNEGSRLKDQPPPAPRRIRRLYVYAQPLWKGILVAVMMVGLTAFVMFLILRGKEIVNDPMQWRLVKFVASLSGAAVGYFLTGMLHVEYASGEEGKPGWKISAAGSFAVFVLVFFFL